MVGRGEAIRVPGRPSASRRGNRLTVQRRVRLRRTLVVSTVAAIALLGALDALPWQARPADPAGVTSDQAGVADRIPELGLAAPARPSARATSESATVAGEVAATPRPKHPPADAKPPASLFGGEPLPQGSGTGKRVVYGISAQQVWLVDETGAVARTYQVSGSRYDQLDSGTYRVFSASRHATSWHGTETMEYMVRFHRGARANIGFHDIPIATASGEEVQTLAQLGTPLSDGCIRQDVADAQALWDFAPVGTAVVVVA